MRMLWLIPTLLVTLVSQSWAATFFVDASLVSNCTSTNYNFQARDCTGTGTNNAYTTASTSTALAQLAAGDTLYFRAGTYATSLAIVAQTVSGTSTNRVLIAGYPGEAVIFMPPTTNLVASSSSTNYITFKNFKVDFINASNERSFDVRSSTDLTFEDIEVTNAFYNGFYLDGVGGTTTFRRVRIHGQRSDCGPGVSGNRFYGIYAHHGTNLLVEDSDIYDNPGGGIQVYTGPWASVIIRNNRIYDNTWCTTSNVGGMIISAASGSISSIEVYNNVIFGQSPGGTGGWGGGITTATTSPYTIANAKFNNNTIYNNQAGATGSAYGINLQGNVTGEVKNNHVVGNETGQILNASTGSVTVSSNRTTGTITDCTVSTADLRLKQGANSCVEAGTSVSTRPSPVGVTDIGAYERGSIVSAVVVSGYIELTANVMTPGVMPATGITALSLTCVTCTGTPALTANTKPGSSNIIQVAVSGLTGSGTARINLGSSNATDSGYVGSVDGTGTAQGLNSLSAFDITGTVVNTSGSPSLPTGIWSEFLLNEGSGTVATDSSGGGNNGTVSSGVTWVNNASGTGVTIPTDSTYRHIASTHGAGVNLTSNSLSVCVYAVMDTQFSQKVLFSAGSNSPGRFYAGYATVNGTKQWGIGIGTSGFTSGVSEFPLSSQPTLVCLRANAATDTAVLSINRTIGTSAAAVKSIPSFALADNIRAGNDGTFTTNNGGSTIYGMWVWNNTYLSDAEIQSFYDGLVPEGPSVGGYAEVTHRCQRVYLTGANGSPINIGSVGQSECAMQDGGAIALEVMLKCTGGDCGPVAVRPYATDNLGNTSAVPQSLGSLGLWMWGNSTDSHLNKGVSTCCMSGGFVAVNGITVLDAVASNTIDLADGEATHVRWIFRCGQDAQDKTYTVEIKQDNGGALSGAAGTTPTLRCVAPTASGGY